MVAALPASARAQTDYYNTDRGRPLRVEDAYPVERRAFEIQAAPLRVERFAQGAYSWGFEPEIAYGIAPRTHVEAGVPLAFIDAAGARRSGVSGVHLSLLHNLNVETSIPALALAASAALPMGSLASDETYFSVTGIATRTLSWARFHLNADYTFGDEPDAGDTGIIEESRWSAGLSVDKTFPLRSLLLAGEIVAEQPLEDAADVAFSAAIGTRYQLAPRWAVDAGVGKRLTGDERSWFITFGSAYAFGLPWRP
jgi:hypothetical protein